MGGMVDRPSSLGGESALMFRVRILGNVVEEGAVAGEEVEAEGLVGGCDKVGMACAAYATLTTKPCRIRGIYHS